MNRLHADLHRGATKVRPSPLSLPNLSPPAYPNDTLSKDERRCSQPRQDSAEAP